MKEERERGKEKRRGEDGRGGGDWTKIGDIHHSLNTLQTQTSLNTYPHAHITHSHQERKIIKNEIGMPCQKVHKQGRIKVMVNIQNLIHPNIFLQE